MGGYPLSGLDVRERVQMTQAWWDPVGTMSSSVLSDKSYNMTAVYGLKPLPFFHSSREWMGEQEKKRQKMMLKREECCGKNLIHACFHCHIVCISGLCMLAFVGVVLLKHAFIQEEYTHMLPLTLPLERVSCLLSWLWKSCSCWCMQILSEYTRELNTGVRTFGPQLSTTFDKADKLDGIF